MDLSILSRLNELRAKREPAILATNTENGKQTLYSTPSLPVDEPLKEEVQKRFLSGKSGYVGNVFLAAYLPSPRLVLIGAVHISQHIVGPAMEAGFDVTVIDPRTAFASAERFPNVTLHAEWPDEILKDKPLDAYTALAALTHDPKIDDIPISAALAADCFYVGALGSRKTHGKRLARLKEQGVSEEALSRIDAPIGLNIGASNPAEIAIAVLGQIIATLRGVK